MTTEVTPPVISVVIPYFKAGAWIEDAIRSVLAQDHPAFEVLVVNDGSPDAAELDACLARVADHPAHARVRVLTQANAGPSAARNRGVEVATGDLVAFLDADDRWGPGLLSRAVRALSGPPAADLVFFDGWTTPASGIGGWRITTRSSTVPEPALVDLLGGTSTVITSGVVMRRAVFLAAGGFDESLRRSEDYDLWLRLLRQGARFRAVAEPMVHRRLQETGLSAERLRMCAASRVVLAPYLTDPALPEPEARAAHRYDRAIRRVEGLEQVKDALRQGRVDAARGEAMRLFLAMPSLGLFMLATALLVAPRGVAARLDRSP